MNLTFQKIKEKKRKREKIPRGQPDRSVSHAGVTSWMATLQNLPCLEGVGIWSHIPHCHQGLGQAF